MAPAQQPRDRDDAAPAFGRKRSMRGRGVTGIALVVIGLLTPSTASAAVADGSAAPQATLEARLPATIDGVPVEVIVSQDLGASLAFYAGQSHPEIDALEAELAARGLKLSDVDTVTAYFGADLSGGIDGFLIPGEDAASLQGAMTAAYLIGAGDLERTLQQVDDHAVTFLSQGPLDEAEFPFAVLPDSDVLWIVTGELGGVIDAVEALLAVSAGTAPGNTSTAPTPTPPIGPATWFGTMSGTTTWDKGTYVGQTTATFRGTLERIEDESVGHCPLGPCAAYRPMGEIAWTFESAAPGPPSCRNHQTGSVLTGDVVIPSDQMLFLEPANEGYIRYYGTGSVSVPSQECAGWEGIRSPGLFFEIPPPEEEHPFADLEAGQRPLCAEFDWRIERESTTLTGTCWRYDEQGYEERFDWDLRRVDPE
jgi:hypothetical protein